MTTKMTLEMVDELKFSVRLCVCRRCGGRRSQPSLDNEERDRGIEDTCYHCDENGMVDEDTDWEDRVADLANEIAARRIHDLQHTARDEEYGYDYALAAAENGMSLSDFITELTWAEADRVKVELAGLGRVKLEQMGA